MLKKRLLGVVVIRDGIAVQSIGFNRYLPIGRPEVIVEFLDQWGIDEIAVLDISATRKGEVSFNLLEQLTRCCKVPLTYGGGLTTVDAMTEAVQAGADKVLINQSFLREPELVTKAGESLGRQCVVVSIDIKKDADVARVYDYLEGKTREFCPVESAQKAAALGAGEVFVNSVDRDGMKTGFDLDIAGRIAKAVPVPVTICGGAGRPEHFWEALLIPNISAVAAANYFNFSEHSVTVTKEYIRRKDKELVRHDTYFNYSDHSILEDGRLVRRNDDALKELLFEYHPKEVI